MKSRFIARFPGEVETVMEIRAERAEKELADINAGATTLSSLLAVAPGSSGAPTSELGAYLELARAHPEQASPSILARVAYLDAEGSHADYAAMRLTQPLPAAIEKKKAAMESLLAKYEQCASYGVAEFTRASAHRTGQVLIEFGDALVASERPDGLSEEDLDAYDAVLEEQSWAFYDRGEDVWSDLLRQVGTAADDPGAWVARTREALWPRLAQRFLHRPEVDYPLVMATPPEHVKGLARSN